MKQKLAIIKLFNEEQIDKEYIYKIVFYPYYQINILSTLNWNIMYYLF